MQAVVYDKYGPPEVLQIADLPIPDPQQEQVLVKVHAASINAADYRIRKADPFLVRLMGQGFLKPKNPLSGIDAAGRVEAVGENVRQFKPGDEVFGCVRGAFAEYALARETYLALKPANRSFEEAAALPTAALTALQGIRYAGGIRPGQRVLIQGASGGVGIFAVQLAKSSGAEVTAVCSTRNLELVRSLGADHVIDYTREDFTHSGQTYDLILAVNGYHPLSAYKRALNPGGVYVQVRRNDGPVIRGYAPGSLDVQEWEIRGWAAWGSPKSFKRIWSPWQSSWKRVKYHRSSTGVIHFKRSLKHSGMWKITTPRGRS
jgi:NADPH:quinone reductase-like Zn-dependent oxidoreductase